MTRILLDRSKSPVQASVALAKHFPDAVKMHQGAEETGLSQDAGKEYLTTTVSYGPGYNPQVGGSTQIKETVAQHMNRFFGLGVDANQIFVTQVNGRYLLMENFAVAADRFPRSLHPAGMIPDMHWPMVKSIAEKKGQIQLVVPYKAARGQFASSMEHALDRFTVDQGFMNNPHAISFVYEGSPSNPLGVQNTKDDLQAGIKIIGDYNRSLPEYVPHIRLHVDMPYYMSFSPNKSSGGSYFQNPYEGLFVDSDKDVEIALVMSESKAKGTAKGGYSVVALTPNLVPEMQSVLSEAVGVSYFPEINENMAQIYAPSNDEAFLMHCDFIRQKYERNTAVIVEAFPDQFVNEGMPNMTCCIDISDLIGRTYTYADGTKVVVQDTNDAVEIFANHGRGVITVNGDGMDGRHLIRFAVKAEDLGEIEQGTSIARDAYDAIASGPAVNI